MNAPAPDPTPAIATAQRRLGQALVALQFGLIGVLAAAGAPAFWRGQAPLGAWCVLAAGALLGGWAVASNRPGNFNIHPAPRAGGRLVVGGPYRWIRHPMYSAVLLFGVACAWAGGAWLGTVGVLLLAGVLAVKAGLEERWMREAHPAYAAYCERSWRFVPGLF